MARGERAVKAPICDICKKEKTLLEEPTEKQSLPVFVCTTKQRPRGMPCDGWIVNVPAQQ